MTRSEWQSQMKKLEDRGKEIEKEYEGKEKKLEETYNQQRDQWQKEIGEARNEQIMGVDGASDRREFAERTLDAVTKGYEGKLGELERERKGDLAGIDNELQELRKQTPLVDRGIDNAELVAEGVKKGVELVLGVELGPVEVGGPLAWEAIKTTAKAAVDRVDQFLDQILENSKDGDRPEEKLENWIADRQKTFDDKYKDSPADQRESMQEKLNQNFDLLRTTLERRPELAVKLDDPPFGP